MCIPILDHVSNARLCIVKVDQGVAIKRRRLAFNFPGDAFLLSYFFLEDLAWMLFNHLFYFLQTTQLRLFKFLAVVRHHFILKYFEFRFFDLLVLPRWYLAPWLIAYTWEFVSVYRR
jgi:hypothetical protein